MINSAEFYKKGNMSLVPGISDFSTETPDEELDGVSMLVEMAKAGKIDPWNIDIVDVTHKCLMHTAEMKSANLRITGRTILFLSILCRIKSNYLLDTEPGDYDSVNAASNVEDDFYEDDYEYFEPEPVKKSNVVSLDEVLQRRMSTRLNRKRAITLRDLIAQLKFYEEMDRKQALKQKLERAKRRANVYGRLTVNQIIKNAHEEFVDKSIETIKEKLEQLFIKDERPELEELVGAGIDRVTAYLALLFLSVKSDIKLVQEEFYGNLYVEKAAE